MCFPAMAYLAGAFVAIFLMSVLSDGPIITGISALVGAAILEWRCGKRTPSKGTAKELF